MEKDFLIFFGNRARITPVNPALTPWARFGRPLRGVFRVQSTDRLRGGRPVSGCPDPGRANRRVGVLDIDPARDFDGSARWLGVGLPTPSARRSQVMLARIPADRTRR